jgi:hypothetical protein
MQFGHGVLLGFEFTVLEFGVRFVFDDEHSFAPHQSGCAIPSRGNRANVRVRAAAVSTHL